MSAKKESDEFQIFSDYESEMVQFESTWNLEKISDKAVPIPTQTDPINESRDQSTNTQEMKSIAVQTESLTNLLKPVPIDDKKLVEALRRLCPIMDSELKQGITHVFRFENN